jgi:hypothetical protein
LQSDYEEAREAWVQARIDDAVQRALKIERLERAVADKEEELLSAMQREIGILKHQRALAELASAS